MESERKRKHSSGYQGMTGESIAREIRVLYPSLNDEQVYDALKLIMCGIKVRSKDYRKSPHNAHYRLRRKGMKLQ